MHRFTSITGDQKPIVNLAGAFAIVSDSNLSKVNFLTNALQLITLKPLARALRSRQLLGFDSQVIDHQLRSVPDSIAAGCSSDVTADA